jgi:hypothetical protein
MPGARAAIYDLHDAPDLPGCRPTAAAIGEGRF